MLKKIFSFLGILLLQIFVTAAGIFVYHKTIFEKPHLLSTGINSFTSQISRPNLDEKTDYIHPTASLIGQSFIGHEVFIAPQASIRGDEGTPIWIGNGSNIQDGVVIHALETEEDGRKIERDLKKVNGKEYAVYIGNRVSLAHQSQVHGPAIIEDDTFIGMQALVFNAEIGNSCVIEPGAKVVGVNIAPHRYVKTGQVVTEQALADALPEITEDYKFKNINKAVVGVNRQLAKTYNKLYGY